MKEPLMRIDTSLLDSPEDYLIQIAQRLRFVESELECPVFMLGASYRLQLRSERIRLARYKENYESMLKEYYE